MSDNRNFSRRRNNRGGMRFRPPGGMNPQGNKPDRASQEARSDALAEAQPSTGESIFDQNRYQREIERAENVAAGLPPEGVPHQHAPEKEEAELPPLPEPLPSPKDYKPVPIKEPAPQGIIESIKAIANKVIQKVQNLIRPKQRSNKEVIINSESLETRVAVLELGRLEEFTIERTTEERLVGSIFKGKVRNLEDALKAAFVDIGFEKNAFLHYWDIVPSNFDNSVEIVERESRRRDRPKVTQKDIPRIYPPGAEIIVQVTKGPIGTKGPRITTNLVLPGRFLVLLPNSDQSGISRKIENPEERQRLKHILRKLHIPEGMGVIIRTAGEGQQERYFVRDLALLLDEWRSIQDRMKRQPLATCIFEEPDLIARTVRDFLTEDVDRIVVDNIKSYERIREMIGRISKRSIDKVKYYNETQPIFDRLNITKQIETTFSRQVMLRSGGYLVIDETEALVAIDVNTGRHKSGPKDHHEGTITKVNLEAAEEICRQLRLRNIGGLIVLDFIDMKGQRERQQVYTRMRDGLRRDKAKTHILPISQLGLMEMTRQRHSESVRSAVYDDCPACKGRGIVKSPVTMSVEIQRKLAEIMRKRTRDESDFQLRIVVHPTVMERLRTEDEKLLIEMEKKFFGKFSFRSESGFHAEQFKIINVANNEELASVGG